jgi:uncharacterized protein YkwD
VYAALNALRAAHGLAPLPLVPALVDVARRHSEAMRSAGLVAHVLPGSSDDVSRRLQRRGVAYRRALENVARGRTALEAHRVAEDSPAHRLNLLDPGVHSVGIGIAREDAGTGQRVYVTEILLDPGATSRDPAGEALAAIQRARALAGLAPLARDPSLDALAAAAAAEMARDGRSRETALARAALELEGRRHAAADATAAAVGPLERSMHVADPQLRRLGVGAATSAGGAVWIAAAYTD